MSNVFKRSKREIETKSKMMLCQRLQLPKQNEAYLKKISMNSRTTSFLFSPANKKVNKLKNLEKISFYMYIKLLSKNYFLQ